jgi:hypothetical protein
VSIAVAACAGFSLTPSQVERWNGPPFPADRIARIDVLSVLDRRGVTRDGAVVVAKLVREAAVSLLREKGYEVATVEQDLDLAPRTAPSDEHALDAESVVKRSPAGVGVALALAVEEAEPDVVAAPSTVRVRLRGAAVDVKASQTLWAGESVAESGFAAGALAASATAAEYGAIYQAMRALLADVPERPTKSVGAPG